MVIIVTILCFIKRIRGESMEHLLLTFNLRISTNHDKENAWPYRLDSIITYLNDRKPLILAPRGC